MDLLLSNRAWASLDKLLGLVGLQLAHGLGSVGINKDVAHNPKAHFGAAPHGLHHFLIFVLPPCSFIGIKYLTLIPMQHFHCLVGGGVL